MGVVSPLPGVSTAVPASASRYCHLRSKDDPRSPACGARAVTRCIGSGQKPTRDNPCGHCERPRCPACRAIWDTYRSTGAWEGA